MAIRKIAVSNFKSFDEIDLELRDFNILIGANASGKSNFIQIFRFLRDIQNFGLDNAISLQGGVEYLRNVSLGTTKTLSLRVMVDQEYRRLLAGRQRGLIIKGHTTLYEFAIRFHKRGRGFDVVKDKVTQKYSLVEGDVDRSGERDIEQGRFRSDLYYRLNVISVDLPPLRDRADDIPLLAEYFLQREAERTGEKPRKLTDEVVRILQDHQWPGNVRELENVIERALVLSSGPTIREGALPPRLREKPVQPLVQDTPPANPTLEVIERAYIEHVLRAESGNKSRAAEVLGIDPSTLYRKIKRYQLDI